MTQTDRLVNEYVNTLTAGISHKISFQTNKKTTYQMMLSYKIQ